MQNIKVLRRDLFSKQYIPRDIPIRNVYLLSNMYNENILLYHLPHVARYYRYDNYQELLAIYIF